MRSVRKLLDEANRYSLAHPRISRIDPDVTRDGVPKWTITFNDGRQGSTVKRSLVEDCYRLQDLHVPVTMVRSKMGYGWALVSIEQAEAV